jgi:signal transduction histidine kinase
MDNGFNKKMLRYTLILGGLNFLISCYNDKDSVSPELFNYYLGLSIFSFIYSIFLFFANEKKDYKTIYSDQFFVIVNIWGIFSQWIIPEGYLTVIIGFFVYSLFSGTSFKKFILFIAPFLCLVIFSIWNTSSIKNTSIELIDKSKSDYTHSVIIMTLFILVSYYLKNKILEKVKSLEAKMFDLGSKSSIFIHDLKNLVGPLVNDSKLVLRKTDTEDIQRINQKLEANISNLKEFILEFNQSFSFKEENGPIKLKEIFDSTNRMYVKKLQGISFDISQKDELVGDPKAFKSILSNLIINSADAFTSNNIIDKKISITYENKKLTYIDTAGGMNPKKLKDISEDSYFTTKEDGSGIGIYTIKKYSALMKGRVSFENYQKGLKITIDFN